MQSQDNISFSTGWITRVEMTAAVLRPPLTVMTKWDWYYSVSPPLCLNFTLSNSVHSSYTDSVSEGQSHKGSLFYLFFSFPLSLLLSFINSLATPPDSETTRKWMKLNVAQLLCETQPTGASWDQSPCPLASQHVCAYVWGSETCLSRRETRLFECVLILWQWVCGWFLSAVNLHTVHMRLRLVLLCEDIFKGSVLPHYKI